MKKLYYAALVYAFLGLGFGLFYREYTRGEDFNGVTQLAVLHTHALALGMMFMLVVLAFEKLFKLSKTKWFNLFFWHYNGGLIIMLGMMVVIGMRQVDGQAITPMLNGISGLAHLVISVGLIFFFVALGKSLRVEKYS